MVIARGYRGAQTRNSRIIKARPGELYDSFLDPEAFIELLPPAKMKGKIHKFDPRVGGGYSMSLFYSPEEETFRGKTSDKEDRVNPIRRT
jgi:hypothetical protein